MRHRAAWAVAVCGLVVAVVVGVLDRREPAQPNRAPVEAAVDAVTLLMTFAPTDTPEQRAAVADRLTGALAADYVLRGPEIVLPGAVASRASMTVDVTDAAAVDSEDRSARVLIFADQTTTIGSNPASRTPVARWAWMVDVDGRWLLARLTPVSPQ